jgi:intracellular septation protein A
MGMATEPTTGHGPGGTGGRAQQTRRDRLGGRIAIAVAIADVVVPIALYYVCRGLGASELGALLISSVAPVVSFVVQAAVTRRVDGLAIFIGAVLLLSVAVAVTSADPRTLLARDGWITALAGLFFLVSLRARRPFVFSIARPFAEGRLGPPGEDWDSVWARFPLFRRVWRVLTVVWGVGLLVDAAIRIVVAYTLPVDVVPAVNGIQYAVVYLVLQVLSQVYLRRSGLMALPGFAFSRRRTV